MNKILYASLMVALLTSCASSYNVTGSSSLSALDGSKLYLKALKSGEVRNIDSCDVVHGEFHFAGLLDTVRVADLFMDEEVLLPVVLEEGDIQVKIGPAGPSVGGTPLNDSLYKFLDKHNQLINQMNELGHKQNQMILEGIDEDTIAVQLNAEAARITAEEDDLVKCTWSWRIQDDCQPVSFPHTYPSDRVYHVEGYGYVQERPFREGILCNCPGKRRAYERSERTSRSSTSTSTSSSAVAHRLFDPSDSCSVDQRS